MKSQVPKLPTFATEKEAAKWFASRDTAPYMDELAKVKEKIPVCRTRPTKKSVGLRLRTDHLDAIKRTARQRGVPYQTLIHHETPANGGGVRLQGAQGDGKSPASGGGKSHRQRTERSEFTEKWLAERLRQESPDLLHKGG